MPHRLFIALRPPGPVRDLLLDAMEGLDEARFVDEDNLHLTLRFVGAVERPAAEDLAAALERVCAAPFTVRIEGVGHFARKGQARALWARVTPSPPLEDLRARIEAACERAGLGRETRRFTPHVTLARLSRPGEGLGRWLAAFGDMRTEWRCDAFRLYESHLGHGGASYQTLAEYPLSG